MKWYQFLTPYLRQVAYKANDEMAWGRHDAISVVSILEQNGYEVIGVDVWLPTSPGPTPYLHDWTKTDSWSDRVAKSARGFIAAFEWERSAEPVFNIVAIPKDDNTTGRKS